MDHPLTTRDDHAEIREEVRKLCARFPGEYWRKLDEARGYPTEFVQALTEAGYLSVLIPEEYGGSGLGISAAAAILETVQAEGCNGSACHAQIYIMGTVLRHGSEAQKAQYLPKIATGELRLQAFGVTEPTSGSDTTGLRTVAKREGDTYVVNGQKVWTSRSEHSDLMLLLARTTPRDEVQKKTEGLSTFIVDMKNTPGLTIRPIRTMMNHNSCEVFFDNMRVPAANLVGEEGRGFRYILDGMNAERLLIAAECIGDAKWFTAKSTAYARERPRVRAARSGRTRASPSRSPRPTPRCAAAELLVRDGLERFEAGLPCGEQANMAKMLAAEASWAAGEACIQTHGGYGFAEEYDIERKFRETRLYQVAPISTNLGPVLCGRACARPAALLLMRPPARADGPHAGAGGCGAVTAPAGLPMRAPA